MKIRGDYEFVVTCGACGADLEDVVHGGSGTHSTALCRCTECGRQWVIHLTMSAYVGCGTDAGFIRHRRRGEKPCDDCVTAHRNTGVDHKRRRRERVDA